MKKLIGLLFLFSLGCATPNTQFINSTRAYYDSVTPMLKEYIKNDSEISSAEKDLINYTLESWNQDIASQEAANAK